MDRRKSIPGISYRRKLNANIELEKDMIMNLQTLRQIQDPKSLSSDHQRSLWYDLNGDWDTAHTIVQAMSDINAMWIHAYLHRKEPDIWNAKYWYNRWSCRCSLIHLK